MKDIFACSRTADSNSQTHQTYSTSSILTLLESVSEDFEWKNGIKGSEFIKLDSGWGLRDEGFRPT